MDSVVSLEHCVADDRQMLRWRQYKEGRDDIQWLRKKLKTATAEKEIDYLRTEKSQLRTKESQLRNDKSQLPHQRNHNSAMKK